MANIIGKFGINETLVGSIEGDLILGNTGADSLVGLAGNDTIIASIDNDTLIGGDGNDLMFGSSGSDTIDGGTGADTLNAGNGQNSLIGGDGNDVLIGSSGSDTLDGGIGDDTIFITRRGDNSIIGGDGNDVLDYSDLRRAINLNNQGLIDKGLNGADTITGVERIIAPQLNPILTSDLNTIDGSGADSIPGSFNVDLGTNSLTINGVPGITAPFTVENFDAVIGTPNADIIAGNTNNNVLNGGGGADSIDGGAGSDTIDGGAGADTLTGGAGNDVFIINDPGDVIIEAAGGGTDTVLIDSTAGTFTLPDLTNIEIMLDVATGATTMMGGNTGTDTMTGGTPGMTITGTANADNLSGTANNDTIDALAGADTITGSAGSDIIDGGADNDVLDYTGLGAAIILQNRGLIDKGMMGTDTIGAADGSGTQTIETIIGDSSFDNAISGAIVAGQTPNPPSLAFNIDLTNNSLILDNAGTTFASFEVQNFNQVTGTVNNDTITGSAGADTITGSAGSDIIDGGAGNDVLDYTGLGTAIELLNRGLIDKGMMGADTIGAADGSGTQTIETIIGDSSFDNAISGAIVAGQTPNPPSLAFNIDLTNNSLILDSLGSAFATFSVQNFNRVTGTVNNDTIVGSAGADTITGSAGSDIIDGGAGTDVLDYTGLGAAIILQNRGLIDKGMMGTDTIGAADGSGTQTIETIIGDTGFDNAISGAIVAGQTPNPPSLAFNIDLTNNSLILDNAGTTFASFSVQNFNRVTGTVNNDTIVGSAGADTITGSAGSDIIDGGAGTDVLDYTGLGTAIELLNRGLIDKGMMGADTIGAADGSGTQTIETIIGDSTQTNSINGTGNNPGIALNVDLGAESLTVVGLPGGDATFIVQNFNSVIGTSQADILTGGAGADTITGGAGADTITGGAGADVFTVDNLGDVVADGEAIDTLIVDTVQNFLLPNGIDPNNVQLVNGGSILNPTPIAVGASVNGTIDGTEPNTFISRSSLSDPFVLTGVNPGQNIQVNLNSTFDTFLELTNLDTGTVIQSNDDFNGLNSQITFTAQAGINYGLNAGPLSTGNTGAYDLITTLV